MITTSSAELLKTLQALVVAYDQMSFVSRYPLDENIEDIKAHIEKLRAAAQGTGGAADMQAETAAERAASLEARRQAYPPALRKYQVTIGAGVRAYATVTVEAVNEDQAWNKARTILQILQDSMGKMVEFEADYETLHDLELLEDLVDITDH